ncbi:NADH dehydrogenase [Datura stramonium]|uniref:NADH dehydrogenase [ubiquinone] iron-sulfur protein 3 n=1 Tax=Datura stramonium TaxID=4076 RepID=A0ABS8S4Z6_DATST|nr:NADH dehydrogenase [ubiquinone] iron-sulfur protein 3 [Datura stramonium]
MIDMGFLLLTYSLLLEPFNERCNDPRKEISWLSTSQHGVSHTLQTTTAAVTSLVPYTSNRQPGTSQRQICFACGDRPGTDKLRLPRGKKAEPHLFLLLNLKPTLDPLKHVDLLDYKKEVEKRVVSEPIEMTQEFRYFDFASPWEQRSDGWSESRMGQSGDKSIGNAICFISRGLKKHVEAATLGSLRLFQAPPLLSKSTNSANEQEKDALRRSGSKAATHLLLALSYLVKQPFALGATYCLGGSWRAGLA